MASTNQTSHYELSQYIGSDKPTYLVDYNQDMAKIDSGIYGAKSEADTNTASIGTLSNLGTTDKTNLVSAINEINTQTIANTTNIGTNTNNITSLNNNVGNLSNLNTTNKSNLVSAVNEVNANAKNIEKFNFLYFDNYTQASDFVTNNATISAVNLTIATNSDGSIGKIYGQIYAKCGQGGGSISIQTRLRPTANISIWPSGITFFESPNATTQQRGSTISISTAGILTIPIDQFAQDYANENKRIILTPSVYFMQDFGDTPQ